MQQAEKLAEQYMQKGEVLFKEAGEFLKDAVKVVPPEEAGDSGVVWDGTDVWTMSTIAGSKKGKEKESEILFDSPAIGRRADALLRKLRSDPERLKADPASENASEAWATWLSKEFEGKGGIDGETWKTKIDTVLNGDDKNEITNLRDKLGKWNQSDFL